MRGGGLAHIAAPDVMANRRRASGTDGTDRCAELPSTVEAEGRAREKCNGQQVRRTMIAGHPDCDRRYSQQEPTHTQPHQ